MSQIQKIAKNNTAQVQNSDGSRSVILYSTEIIRHWPADRNIRLCTGGYNTSTTRNRMNQALNEWNIPAGVSMQGGIPSCSLRGEAVPFSRDGICYFTY